MTPRILKNFNTFVNGRGKAGVVEKIELPELDFTQEAYRAGGMDAETEVDMGQKAMTAKFTFCDIEPADLSLVGIINGNSVRTTSRGAYVRDSDGTTVAVVCELAGKFKKVSMEGWESGKKANQDYEMAVNYYRLNVAGQDIVEIDVINMVRRIGGVDQLAAVRAAIGL